MSLLTIPTITSLFDSRQPSLLSNKTICGMWTLSFKFLQRHSRYLVMIISVTRTIAIISPFHHLNKRAVIISCIVYAVILVVVDAGSTATGTIIMRWSSEGPLCIWTVEKESKYNWVRKRTVKTFLHHMCLL